MNCASDVYFAECDGKLCAMTSILHFPHPHKKNCKKLHRTIVLPDFQGLGLANVLCNYVCEKYSKAGYSIITTLSNPAMIHVRKKSPNWICTNIGRLSTNSKTAKMLGFFSSNRITASFEYKPNK